MLQDYNNTVQYNESVLIFTPSYSTLSRRCYGLMYVLWIVHQGIPWWTIQSWVGWRNWQQTETCREDQKISSRLFASFAVSPSRVQTRDAKRVAHSGPSESVEWRGQSKRQNADEHGWMLPTLGCTCWPSTTTRMALALANQWTQLELDVLADW